MEKQKVIVMSASRYKMVDSTTGVVNEGTTVRFAAGNTLEPHQEENLKGYKFGKASLSFEQYDQFKVVPGVYSVDYNINIASDGTMKVRAENFEYVGPVTAAMIGSK